MRPPVLRLYADEIVVDNFAGGGGASTGIEWAIRRSPDIAINHDAEAIAMHRANHPSTEHYCESVWTVDPVKACRGRRVGLAWFSPDCTFHSKARGGKPFRDRKKANQRRGLAGVVVRWARKVKPRIICLENVEEFKDWGPLLKNGKPCKKRRGEYFRRWWRDLERAGFKGACWELRACDYGSPTTRKRLFCVFRSDGIAPRKPVPTHGPGRLPYRTAAECIDWSIPTRSIFNRKKALSANTEKRIARGLQKFVFECPAPFLVPLTHGGDARVHPIDEPMRTITGAHRGEHAVVAPIIARIGQQGGNGKYSNDAREPLTAITTKGEHLLVAPTLIQTSWGERKGQKPRIVDLHAPLGTVMAEGVKVGVVHAWLAKHFGGEHENGTAKARPGKDAREPMDTITARDHHGVVATHLVKLRGGFKDHVNTAQSVEAPMPTLTANGNHVAEVRAFLIKYYSSGDGGADQGQQLGLPLHTVPTKARFGVVTIHGVDYQIVDIQMRMVTPRELYNAHRFPRDYQIDIELGETVTKKGKRKVKKLSAEAKVRMVGNSVPPDMACAVAAAQLYEDAVEMAA